MKLDETIRYWAAQVAGGIVGALILWALVSSAPTWSGARWPAFLYRFLYPPEEGVVEANEHSAVLAEGETGRTSATP